MTDTMKHRGPDGGGVKCFAGGTAPPASLGHRGLSIIDPTPRGGQPMAYGNEEALLDHPATPRRSARPFR